MILEYGKLTITKNDLITIKQSSKDNLQINICDKEPVYKDYENFRISFDNSDTLDYFIEKLRIEREKIRQHAKYHGKKTTIRNKMDSLRLKAILIDKELNKISQKINR